MFFLLVWLFFVFVCSGLLCFYFKFRLLCFSFALALCFVFYVFYVFLCFYFVRFLLFLFNSPELISKHVLSLVEARSGADLVGRSV